MPAENWYLQVIREGIRPVNEANTSRYVHEVLTRCFGWPFQLVEPQTGKRGFIDYKLRFPRSNVALHVEVKPFGRTLREDMIRPYLVRRGPSPAGEDLRVGALTNLVDWQVFACGPEVKELTGDPMCMVRWHQIEAWADIAAIRTLVGYRGNGDLRELRAALGESDEVLRGVLVGDDEVIRAIRRELADIRDCHTLEVSVPQTQAIRDYLDQLLDGSWQGDCPFSLAKFRQAVGSRTVAETIDDRLGRRFGSRSCVSRIQRTLREWVRDTE